MDIDSIYTPPTVAQTMVQHAAYDHTRGPIADFAVGDGELLRAAVDKWPEADFFGLDIDYKAITHLTREQPGWMLDRCDFLDAKARHQSPQLRALVGRVSLALLNPPFSHRGFHRLTVGINGITTTCSQGLAFLVTALPYMAPRGEVVAILPAGTLWSEMDQHAWKLLEQIGSRVVLGINGEKTFPRFLPKTVLIKLSLGPRRKRLTCNEHSTIYSLQNDPHSSIVNIQRGRVDMPSWGKIPIRRGVPLIHTTELTAQTVDLASRQVDSTFASFKDHAVLIPRVCRPSPSKVCLYLSGKPIALSKCVIAMRCPRKSEAIRLHKAVLKNWSTLRSLYTGTCAQYITLNRVRSFLEALGFRAQAQTYSRVRRS